MIAGWWIALGVAWSAPEASLGREPDRVLSVGLGVSPIVGVDGAAGALGQATLLVHLPPLSIEVVGAEGAVTSDTRTVGCIGIGLRKHIAYGTWARVLFAHHHESLWDDFVAHPAASFAGTHGSIDHRSGVDVGFGVSPAVGPPRLDQRLRVDVGVSVRAFPGTTSDSTPVYVGLQVGVLGRVGPRWQVRVPPAASTTESLP
jgi:hypothetical protein